MKKYYLGIVTVLLSVQSFAQYIRINQVGYEKQGYKTALIEHTSSSIVPTTFELHDASNSSVVQFTGTIVSKGQVTGWSGRYFWLLDFSSFAGEGTYYIQAGSLKSNNFKIGKNLLFNQTAFSVVDFFKGMRHTETTDKTLSFNGTRDDVVNVYGGWIDATGDPGKHFSHLSYANYFSPQQIPMVVWSLLESYSIAPADFTDKADDLTNEVLWGVDYVYRNLDPVGYFYLSVFDDWGNSPYTREICEWGQVGQDNGRTANYQSAMREGGGLAIAALARAYTDNIVPSGYTRQQLLDAAVKAYNHLAAADATYGSINKSYCNDHTENIIDHYCGLMASIELYKATKSATYATRAHALADSLGAYQNASGWFWSNSAKTRPFFHAADEGLPIVALCKYMKEIPSPHASAQTTIDKAVGFYYKVTKEVNNPFTYIRQANKPYSSGTLGTQQNTFFLPHSNETGYWWQGENARLASMSAALMYAAKLKNSSFAAGTDSVTQFAVSQLDWILGKNPFDVCMMYGFGYTNYPHYKDGSAYRLNVKGGICNGITAKDGSEADIDWKPYTGGAWENWRWIEQWLPHDAWYLIAVSSLASTINLNQQVLVKPVVTITSPASGAQLTKSTAVTITATAVDSVIPITKVEFFVSGISLGIDTQAPYSFSWTPTVSGTYVIKVVATNATGTSGSSQISVTVPGSGPYLGVFNKIPGVVEAEDFDEGGETVAYHDTDSDNKTGAYRTTESVDVESSSIGYNIAYTEAGEWLNYSVAATVSGNYTFKVTVASTQTTAKIYLKLDGTKIGSSLTVPNTGSWTTYDTVKVSDISIKAGFHVLTLYIESSACNINNITATVVPVDCNGVLGGSAYYDYCGICVGGTTSQTACTYSPLLSQTIDLQKGWNLISFDLQPTYSSVDSVFKPVKSNLLEVKTLDAFFNPTQAPSFNSLESVENGKAYFVKVSQASTLAVNGTQIASAQYAIDKGWNLVGVPVSTPATISSKLVSPVSLVKNLEGFWVPSGTQNSLTTFVPGKGYLVKATSETTISW